MSALSGFACGCCFSVRRLFFGRLCYDGVVFAVVNCDRRGLVGLKFNPNNEKYLIEMKKIIGLVALSLLSLSVEAKVMRVNNTPNIDAGYSSLENALLDAASGDTIYLEASSQAYGSRDAYSFDDIEIVKPVTIIGPGFLLAENRVTGYAPGEAFIGGEVKLLAENVHISGIILPKLEIEANGAMISRCQILAGSSDAIKVASNVNGCSIQQCFVVGNIEGRGYPQNVFISNNIICGNVAQFERCRIEHNTFGKYSRYGTVKGLKFCTVVENVMYEQGKTQTNTSAFINNYSGDFSQYMEGSEFSLDSNYRFKSDSPIAMSASDGGALGAFGGVNPYIVSGLPSIPVVYNVSAPTSVNLLQGMPVAVTYNLSAALDSSELIVTEYFFDKDPGYGKGLLGGPAKDGKLKFDADMSGLSVGFHTLNVRGRNSEGWSHTVSYPFVLFEKVSEIVGTEYFYNEDPGEGKGIFIKSMVLDSLRKNITLKKPDVSSLRPGYHTLNIRALDNANKWSEVVTTPFVYMELPAKVTNAEYYFDEDPGVGNANTVNVAEGGLRLTFPVDLSGLAIGKHTLYVRTLDEEKKWHIEEGAPFEYLGKGSVKWSMPIAISPNPAKYSFTVEFAEKISDQDSVVVGVSLVTPSGKELDKVDYVVSNNVVTISVSNNTSGSYLVNVKKGDAVSQKRLIIKR